MVLTRATAALTEVVLEIRIAARDCIRALQCFPRKRRAAEIRVDDHAGGVDRPSQARPACCAKLGLDSLDEVAWVGACPHLFTRTRERRSRRRDEQGPRRSARQPLVSRELVHRRQVAQFHERSVER